MASHVYLGCRASHLTALHLRTSQEVELAKEVEPTNEVELAEAVKKQHQAGATANKCSVHCRRVEGGSDKDTLVTQLMQDLPTSSSIAPISDCKTDAAPKVAVYVGDSPSDLAPLLKADVGIVVGQNQLLRQVAKALGVKLKPLTAGLLVNKWHEPLVHDMLCKTPLKANGPSC